MTNYPAPSDPVSALTRPNGTTEAHSVDHGRMIGFAENVDHYGAVGAAYGVTPTADDSAAFTAAIAAAVASGTRAVYFPRRYRIGSTLIIPTNFRLFGAHRGYSSLWHDAGSDPLLQVNYVSSNVWFHDFTIVGTPNVPGTGTGIYIAGTTGGSSYITNTTIENIGFITVGDASHWGIHTDWGLETHITGCTFTGCLGGGIRLGDTSNGSTIRNCTMSNGAAGALNAILVEADGALLEGNVLESWRGTETLKVTGDYCNIIRNWFEDNSNYDVYLDTCTDANLMGNNHTTVSPDVSVQGDSVSNLTIVGERASQSAFVLTSGAGAGAETRATLISCLAPPPTVSGLSNANDFVMCIGNRNDFAPGPGIELQVGKMYFGSAWDTNLYRSAANVLKTDDKLITAAGLGVGNSASATTPGSVVKKMEVFDASGNSLGYVPIYNTIT